VAPLKKLHQNVAVALLPRKSEDLLNCAINDINLLGTLDYPVAREPLQVFPLSLNK